MTEKERTKASLSFICDCYFEHEKFDDWENTVPRLTRIANNSLDMIIGISAVSSVLYFGTRMLYNASKKTPYLYEYTQIIYDVLLNS